MYTATNPLVLENIRDDDISILDVGCGTGNTAKNILALQSQAEITGINSDAAELSIAKQFLNHSIQFDLNSQLPLSLSNSYDLIICSHILEHLISPIDRVSELSNHLKPNGRMLLIVPNFAIWKARLRLLRGKFEYAEHGLYDRTHLRFYTWLTFANEVVPEQLLVESYLSSGNFPLPGLRRLLPQKVSLAIDRFFLDRLPNLFSSEVGLIVRNR